MTITSQEVVNPGAGFPFMFVDAMQDVLKVWLPSHLVVARPLRMTDSARSIGIFPSSWSEIPNTKQMGQIEAVENRYVLKIQVMVKSMNEFEGRALFANDSKLVRVILYRDPDLALRLGGLQEVLLGSREMVQKFGVTRQSFESSELAGSFNFLSVTDYTIDTATTAN